MTERIKSVTGIIRDIVLSLARGVNPLLFSFLQNTKEIYFPFISYHIIAVKSIDVVNNFESSEM